MYARCPPPAPLGIRSAYVLREVVSNARMSSGDRKRTIHATQSGVSLSKGEGEGEEAVVVVLRYICVVNMVVNMRHEQYGVRAKHFIKFYVTHETNACRL